MNIAGKMKDMYITIAQCTGQRNPKLVGTVNAYCAGRSFVVIAAATLAIFASSPLLSTAAVVVGVCMVAEVGYINKCNGDMQEAFWRKAISSKQVPNNQSREEYLASKDDELADGFLSKMRRVQNNFGPPYRLWCRVVG